MSGAELSISIVVPSYQQGTFIDACLDSILSQSYSNVEIIAFDSESTDDTLEVLERYRDRVEVIVEKDLGQAHAINKGLRRCKGDVIGFLNSDDLLLPGSLEKVADYWGKVPSTDLLYGKAKYIDILGDTIGDYRTAEWDLEKFYGECFICQPAAFWSRRIMNEIGLLDQCLNCSLDYDYWLRIAQAGGSVCSTDDYLACSRDYSATKTRSLRGQIFIENFQISLRRLGYIHRSWISQYLNYLKYERKGFASIFVPSYGEAQTRFASILEFFSSFLAKDVYQTQYPYRRIV